MPRRKIRIKTNEQPEDTLGNKPKQTLVFISHDTRDAEIAELFSKLLGSVSAGVLKAFRSSDRKGTQGIEYGVEWFPEIMKKLDDASDIVCLLTQTSVDRPWILYEAGVAMGKLNTKVLGVALGIPLSKASSGPFAQFQNCPDDEDSLTKLVLQLVRRIPNAEPDESVVKAQVKVFKQKLTEQLKTSAKLEKNQEPKEEDSVAKLFEEVKIMFQDLPSRIDKRLDPDLMMRRRRKFHPKMLDELFHLATRFEDPNLSFLIMVSMFKDEMPWFYEVGVETYRTLKSAKTKAEKQKAISTFGHMTEMMGHPVLIENYSRSEDSFMLMKEMRHMMHRFLDGYLVSGKE
jgi:hypothetical protein